jgi:hypothetical protein
VPAYIGSVGFAKNGHISGTVTQTQMRPFSGTLSLPESGRSFIVSATQTMVGPLLAATVVC